MSAEERVANTLQARLSWPQAEACASDAIAALRADPVAVLSLLPDEVLADIDLMVRPMGDGQRIPPVFEAQARLLPLLDQVQS